MIVTTGKTVSQADMKEAQRLAENWGVVFQERKKRSFRKWVQETNEPIYVVSKTGDKLYHPHSSQPFHFHPSMAWLRVQRIFKGYNDPMAEAMDLKEGMTCLDCTMGLASDSIVASFITGKKGYIASLEKNKYIAEIVRKGLQHWEEERSTFNQAMRRIVVANADYFDFLKNQTDEAFDIVYFDPMFEQTVESSVHIAPLRSFANYETLQAEQIKEALRVAKRKVVVKSSIPNPHVEEMGFVFKKRRKGASFGFAVMEKKGNRYE
ncbi:class I SAM-dependent methyltransferase [Alteribacillus bidgolensis]|uniref:Putative SAM-dependent methyltransferase n=1 Tax=Alteribacillus bidgolensis TaxID=930129 RepID=A0A1G8D933_9BACI|nr:class I SAM-dependent methyltransferase [Alteribacillus bidgolensis]SDH54162.1 Putative SAM-dependent methyltransferase [Alteribacillus bidgolensis]